jgi:rubredoxin
MWAATSQLLRERLQEGVGVSVSGAFGSCPDATEWVEDVQRMRPLRADVQAGNTLWKSTSHDSFTDMKIGDCPQCGTSPARVTFIKLPITGRAGHFIYKVVCSDCSYVFSVRGTEPDEKKELE